MSGAGPRRRPTPRRPYGCLEEARHDGARNILVRLGKVAGLREGVDMDVEVPYLFTRYRPGDIRVRIRPGGQVVRAVGAPVTCIFRGQPNGFELPGAAPRRTRPSRTLPTT